MAQWTNFNRSNIFINPTSLPLLCEKSGAIHLAEPGLTAGRLADKIQKCLKFTVDRNIRLFTAFNKDTA